MKEACQLRLTLWRQPFFTPYCKQRKRVWEEKSFLVNNGLDSVQSTLNTLVCWLLKLSKQSKENCFITAQDTKCSSRGGRSFQILTSNAQVQKTQTSKNDKLRLYKQFQHTALLKEYVLDGSSSNKSLLLSLQQ